jgi:fucose permease
MELTKTGKSNNILLNINCFLAIMIFGVAFTMASPILLEISQYLETDIESMGIIFSILFAGFMSGAFLGGILTRVLNRKINTLVFYFILPVSIFSVALSSNFLIINIMFFFIGLSGGFIEVQTGALVMDLNKKKEGLYISILHVFYGIGALTGPLLSSLLVGRGLSWKIPFYIVAVLGLLNLILLAFLKVPEPKVSGNNKMFTLKSFKRLDRRMAFFILLVFSLLFYVAAESGITSWLPTFLRLDRGLSNVLAGRILSFFWISIMVGRIIIGFLTRKIKLLYILIITTFISIFSTALGLYSNNLIYIIIAFILSGFFLSGIFTLIFSIGGTKYPDKRSAVLSAFTIFAGIGGILAPWFIGKIYQSNALLMGMNFIYIFLIIVFLLAIALLILDRKIERQSSKNKLK